MFNTIFSSMLLFVFSIFSISTNDIEKYNFYGSNNNWKIIYETEMSTNKEWADFSFEYIGKEDPPNTFEYNLKSSWFELSDKEVQFNHSNENINSGNSECTGPPINDKSCEINIEKDTQLEAIIKWNGKSETIILKIQ